MSQNKMIISSIFSMPGQGTVLRGEIIEGRFYCGQRVTIFSPNNSVEAQIQGFEKLEGKLVRDVKKGESVSFLFGDIDFNILDDGVKRVEPGEYEPIDLHISCTESPWWKFWED